MDIKIKTPIIASLLLLVSWLGNYPGAIAASTLDKIAAVVDDDVVMLSDVRTRALQLKSQQTYAGLSDKALLKEALEQLILDSLQLQKARQIGLSVSDTALNATMEKLARQNNLTLSQFQQALQQEGIHYPSFRENIRQRLIINELRKRQLQRETHITNQEVDDLIANQSAQISQGVQYRYQHILVPAPAGTPLPAFIQAQKQAEKLREDLLTGKDPRFSQADSPASWKEASAIPPTLLRHLALLEKGEISTVFQDSKGFHIVKLLDKKGMRKAIVEEIHARHILLKPDAEHDDAHIKNQLTQIRNQIRAGADFAQLAKQYSQDPGSASNGGDLGWSTPDAYVPAFAKVLKSTPENQISPPFKSKFGWHILQVLERKTIDRTEDLLRNQAKQLINKNKASEAYKSWVKQLRNDAFVEYRIQL